MKKLFIISIFILSFLYCLNAQNENVDSLNQILQENPQGFERLKALNKLCAHFRRSDYPLSKKYALEAYQISSELEENEETLNAGLNLAANYMERANWDSVKYLGEVYLKKAKIQNNLKYQAWSLNMLGNYEKSVGNFSAVEEHFKEGLRLSKMIPDSLWGISIFSINLGNLYNNQLSKPNVALEYYKRGLSAAELNNDSTKLGVLYSSIGNLHSNFENYETALEYYNRSKNIKELRGDKKGLVFSYYDLAFNYNKSEDFPKSIECGKKGLELTQEIGYKYMEPAFYSNLGETFLQSEKLDEAKKMNRKLQDFVSDNQIESGQVVFVALELKGSIFFYEQKYEEAIVVFEQYIKNVEAEGQRVLGLQMKPRLAEAHEKLGNFKESLSLFKTFYEQKDSIQKSKRLDKLAFVEAQLSDAEKEKEIVILEKNKIADEAQLKQTRSAALGIGALALLGFGFFYNARRQNKIIAEKNDQLETLNTTKDRIFAIIGHDLRKPAISFRGISKVINYLLDKEDYTRLKKVGAEVEKDALSLYKLTDNLLSWALLQKDVMPHNPSEVSVSDIADETVTVFQRVADEKGITLTSQVPHDLKVYADPNSLATIIRNLTDNALKYTPAGGNVIINAVESVQGVKIEVEDTGIGMEQEKLKDIFLLQKDKSQKGTKGEKGTGLGLHLIKDLITINGGKVEVESKQGKGTKVMVMLPKLQMMTA